MNKQDKILLKLYNLGFSHELCGQNLMNAKQFIIAYNLGRLDAQAGDDLRSVDYQTEEEILKRIKANLESFEPSDQTIEIRISTLERRADLTTRILNKIFEQMNL
jgi:hypothetical protein